MVFAVPHARSHERLEQIDRRVWCRSRSSSPFPSPVSKRMTVARPHPLQRVSYSVTAPGAAQPLGSHVLRVVRPHQVPPSQGRRRDEMSDTSRSHTSTTIHAWMRAKTELYERSRRSGEEESVENGRRRLKQTRRVHRRTHGRMM